MKTLLLLLICTIALCNTNLVSNTTETNPAEEISNPPPLPVENVPTPATPSDESESSDDTSESSSDESDDRSDSESDREARRFPGGHPHGPWRHHRGPRPQWQRGSHPHPHEAQFNSEEMFEVPRGDFENGPHWRPHHGHRRPHWGRRHHPRGSEEARRLISEDSSDFANVTNTTESEGPSDDNRQWKRHHHGPRRPDWHRRPHPQENAPEVQSNGEEAPRGDSDNQPHWRPHHGHGRPHWGRRPHPRGDAPEAQSNSEELSEVPTHEGQEFRRGPHWHRRHPGDHHRRQHQSQESEGSIPEQPSQPEIVAI